MTPSTISFCPPSVSMSANRRNCKSFGMMLRIYAPVTGDKHAKGIVCLIHRQLTWIQGSRQPSLRQQEAWRSVLGSFAIMRAMLKVSPCVMSCLVCLAAEAVRVDREPVYMISSTSLSLSLSLSYPLTCRESLVTLWIFSQAQSQLST